MSPLGPQGPLIGQNVTKLKTRIGNSNGYRITNTAPGIDPNDVVVVSQLPKAAAAPIVEPSEQSFQFVFPSPSPGDKTNWINLLFSSVESNLYRPVIAYANIVSPSSTDVKLDVFVSHYNFATNTNPLSFISIFSSPMIIPAGHNLVTAPVFTFATGAYFNSFDIVYAQLTSVAFNGGQITLDVLFE